MRHFDKSSLKVETRIKISPFEYCARENYDGKQFLWPFTRRISPTKRIIIDRLYDFKLVKSLAFKTQGFLYCIGKMSKKVPDACKLASQNGIICQKIRLFANVLLRVYGPQACYFVQTPHFGSISYIDGLCIKKLPRSVLYFFQKVLSSRLDLKGVPLRQQSVPTYASSTKNILCRLLQFF